MLIKRGVLRVLWLLSVLFPFGCVEGPPDDVEATSQAITGYGTSFTDGFASVQVGSSGARHMGLVIAPDLVFIHSSWLAGTPASNLVVQQFDHGTGATIVNTTGRYVNVLGQGAVIQTVAQMNVGRPFDTATPLATSNRLLQCSNLGSYNGGPIELQATVNVTGVTGGELTFTATNGSAIDAGDLGIPCADNSPLVRKTVGYVVSDGSGHLRIRPYATDVDLINNIRLLATVRNSGATPIAITTQYLLGSPRPPFTLPVDNCLDVENADIYPQANVNYFPCHGGQNQRWWLDRTVDAAHPRIISDVSGQCIDVPWGNAVSGQNLQQYPCHTGLNQKWTITDWPTSPTLYSGHYQRLSPMSGPSLCLSVESWNNSAVRPSEQRNCTLPNGDYDQKWLFRNSP